MFCPKCRSLMISSGGQLKCRKCGFLRDFPADDSMHRTEARGERVITIIEDETGIATLPTIKITCSKCGHNMAF